MAWLIGRGHIHAYHYGINFLQTAIKESFSQWNEDTANVALAVKISRLEGKDYTKAIDSLIKPLTLPEVNHEENLKRFGKKNGS